MDDFNFATFLGAVVRIFSVMMLVFVVLPVTLFQTYLGRKDPRAWLRRKRLTMLTGISSVVVLSVPTIVSQIMRSMGMNVEGIRDLASVSGSLAVFILVLTITSFFWGPFVEMVGRLFKKD